MSRRDIYYWKCDRPAAFHGTQTRGVPDAEIEHQLDSALRDHFKAREIELTAASGQGNHLTWNADVDGVAMFVRVENGPEKDGHLAVESAIIDQVRNTDVLTPTVHGCDATRNDVPFAWQALERIHAPDLNHWHKQGRLNTRRIAFEIGAATARWQALGFAGFGPLALDPDLRGYHASYADYFCLRLHDHLAFLKERGFLNQSQCDDMAGEVENHRPLLNLGEAGCFVHKDLALWNILGTENEIRAFIDFDDSISGDPMDDISLLACFHDARFLARVLEGYQSVRPLPAEHRRRFWLHLLRNMIVKAVIRVGAGYFERSDGFFLIGAGASGEDLRRFTEQRLALALQGLRSDSDFSSL